MPKLFQSFRQRLQRALGGQPGKPVSIVAERFLQVFLDHGVEVAQIPRLMPHITLDILHSPERLLAGLTPDNLAWVAQFFGVRLEWLEGVDEVIYDYLCVGKEPKRFLEELQRIVPTRENLLSFPLRVVATGQWDGKGSPQLYGLTPILVEKVAELGEEDILRYHVYRDAYPWDHHPGRIELKAIARVVHDKLVLPVPIMKVSPEDFEEVVEGRLIPRRLVDRACVTDPSLEDYALSKAQSGVAKEVEELPEVLAYIDEQKLMDFPLAWREEPAEVSAPVSPITSEPEPEKRSAATSKRATANADWKIVLAYVEARRAQDPSIRIGEMIEEVMANGSLKPPGGESAIRKRIRNQFPKEARKPGRRAKQPS